MRLLERLRRFDPRRKLRLDLDNLRLRAGVLAAERDAHLRERDCSVGERNEYLHQRDAALGERNEFLHQRDIALGERNEFLHQRDIAFGERNELLQQRDVALGERNELLQQRDVALGQRNELLHQRDVAIGERNEFLRQRDVAIGEKNLLVDWVARHAHRADMSARPAATPDRLLLFLHLAKTGGVTLSDILARNLAIDEFLQIRMAETDASAMGTWSHIAVERALGRLQAPEVARLRVIWGHYREGVQARLPKSCAVMTMLRDPVDRFMSAYYYSTGATAVPVAMLADAIDRPHYDIGFDNYMTRILSGNPALDPIAATSDVNTDNSPRPTEADFEAAARNLDGYLVVGTTDQFDETLLVLGSDLCWSLSDLVYRPLNSTASRPPHSDVPDAVREKVLSWNRYDSALAERARAHLARRIAGYRGDFGRDLGLFRDLNSLYRRGAPAEELRRMERESRSSVSARQ